MKISLVMTNWNGREILSQTLPTLLSAKEFDQENHYELILIDDCSTDDSIDYVTKEFPEIIVHKTPKNIGSIAAANFGVCRAASPYVMLLNSDMKLSPDSVQIMAGHIKKEKVFAVTPSVFDWNNNFQYGNRGGCFCWGHFSQREKPQEDTQTQTLFACGGAFLFKKEIYEKLGGYDNDLFYPYYYEEVDISYRALKRGFRIIYEPQAKVYHKIRASISKDTHFHKIRIISARNNYLFTWKNITDPGKVIAMIALIPLFLLRDLLCLRFRFWKSLFQALPKLPQVLKKRKEEKKHSQLTDKKIFEQVKG